MHFFKIKRYYVKVNFLATLRNRFRRLLRRFRMLKFVRRFLLCCFVVLGNTNKSSRWVSFLCGIEFRLELDSNHVFVNCFQLWTNFRSCSLVFIVALFVISGVKEKCFGADVKAVVLLETIVL